MNLTALKFHFLRGKGWQVSEKIEFLWLLIGKLNFDIPLYSLARQACSDIEAGAKTLEMESLSGKFLQSAIDRFILNSNAC